MAQNKDQKNKSGSKPAGGKGKTSGTGSKSSSSKSSPEKKKTTGTSSSGTSARKTSGTPKSAGKSAAGSLDSVRGGAKRTAGTSRAQEAVQKAAGRGKKQENSAPAAKKTSEKKTSSGSGANKSGSSGKGSTAKKNGSAGNSSAAFQRMAIIAVLVAVCAVFVVQVVSCAGSRVDTRQTVMVTLTDDIETIGIAIRNEQIITSDRSGVIVSAIENGGKVSKGETVANIFDSADAANAYQRMAEIEYALEQFESMATAGEESAAEVTALEKSIDRELLAISESVYGADFSGSAERADELLYLLNKTQIATRVTEDFSNKVNVLETELQNLRARYPDKPGQLRSPLSGYFINNADGYESLLSTEICAGLTPEKLDEILAVRSEPRDGSTVGKIADDYIWYMACEVSAEDADRLAKNSDGSHRQANYKLFLTYSDLDSITAKLISVNAGADLSRRVLIFECSYMVSELSAVRIQPVTIQLSSYSGLEVSADSVTFCDVEVSSSDIADSDTAAREALAKAICPSLFNEEGVIEDAGEASATDIAGFDPYAAAARLLVESPETPIAVITAGLKLPREIAVPREGVYIVWGNEIKFKRIRVIYRTEDKVLCEYNVGSNWLKMYDSVVDDPKGVYDGKIINIG